MLSDSNKLLREEKRSQDERVKVLEGRCEELEGEMGPLKESIRQLTAQKDVLVAEKTALRYVALFRKNAIYHKSVKSHSKI